MQLSKFSYYSDFVVYPITVVALTAVNFTQFTWHGGREWLGACLAGLVLWTLAGIRAAPNSTASHAGILAHAQPASRRAAGFDRHAVLDQCNRLA